MHRSVLSYIEGYDPGMFPRDAQERYGILPRSVVNLASNENPYPPPKPVLEAVACAASSLNRYPDPSYRSLKKGLSEYLGHPIEDIAVGNGSTEILDMVCKVFLEPFDKIVAVSPSYSMYAFMGMLRDAAITFVQTKHQGFQVDADSLLAGGEDAKIIFLCSPNNPTGMTIKRDELEKIVDGAKGIVVIDEAYTEFSQSSSLDMVSDHPNLIVTRSMSKFFSMAGLRIGYAIAEKSISYNLEKVRTPFSITSISEVAAIAAISCLDYYSRVRDIILNERRRVFKELSRIDGVKPHPSAANFIMVGLEPPVPDLVDRLCQKGVLVRDLKGVDGLDGDYIRLTIGTRKDNEVLIESLKKILQE